jgi:hypothetical protein
MTPQEREVAFQRQALENGNASLENLRNELAAAQAARASSEDLAEIQQRIDGQIRVNGFTQENLNDALAKAGQAIETPGASTAEVVSQSDGTSSPTGIQAFDDGSTLQTFDDGSTLATNPDGTTSFTEAQSFSSSIEEDPTNGRTSPLGTAYDDDGNLNPGWSLDEDNNPVYVGGGFVEPATQELAGQTRTDSKTLTDSDATRAGVARGAQPANPPAAQARWTEAKDLRVKLRVPSEYIRPGTPSAGPANIIQKNGGILFPYTPQIQVENTANYSNQTPFHSNYNLYFYKNSTVGQINVTAKFSVQTEFEGAVLLGVIHLLRALTKMKFGNDPDAGSPPPVCRFDAYGDYMLYNVPVAVASWRHELPDGVDYIAVGRPGSPQTYGRSMVPTMSTISLTLNPMYSRRELLAHNVKDWLSGGLEYRGYL